MEFTSQNLSFNPNFSSCIKKLTFLHLIGALCILGNLLVHEVSAHGRLIEPPSRASMWRFGFDTEPDYNDHEGYCGGLSRQIRNHGKCGICGDAWDTKRPRAHETGGKYGKGIIVRTYRRGAIIPIKVELTANHRGYFEFRTCPMYDVEKEVSQDCLDSYLLRAENDTVRYYPGEGNRIFEAYYKLPDDLTCGQCVFQWRYVAGNNWGRCDDGTEMVGCGPQEEFRACADITIVDDGEILPPIPTVRPPTKRPSTTKPSTTRPLTSTESTETTYYEPGEYEPIDASSPLWVYNFVIAGTCLLVVLAVMGLLYTYYYHAGRAKKWLMFTRLRPSDEMSAHTLPAPVAPPRLKKQNNLVAPINQMHI